MPGIVGFQDLWVAGSRFYFQRDDTSSTTYPLLDLGTVNTISPTIEPTVLQLKDGDGGRLNLIDEGFSDINENYDVVIKNLNQENLQFLFLADEPTELADATAIKKQKFHIGAGKLMKLMDASGDGVYSLTNTLVSASGKPDFTGASNGFLATYSTAAGTTNVHRLTEFDGTNSSAADFEVVSRERGLVRFFAGGNAGLSAAQAASRGQFVGLATASASAGRPAATMAKILDSFAAGNKRLLKPQSLSAPVRGKGYIVFSRSNNTQQSVREFSCTILPSSANFQVEDFSEFTLNVSVLSDISADNIAGRYMYIKGDEPTSTPGQGNAG